MKPERRRRVIGVAPGGSEGRYYDLADGNTNGLERVGKVPRPETDRGHDGVSGDGTTGVVVACGFFGVLSKAVAIGKSLARAAVSDDRPGPNVTT